MNTQENSNPRLPIGFALANCQSENSREIYDYLSSNLIECDLFTLRAGQGRKAAFDAMLILNTASSIATLATVFWAVYKRFFRQVKSESHRDSGIYICVPRSDGTNVELWIGKDVLTEEQLREGIEVVVESLTDPDMAPRNKMAITSIESSEDWVHWS
jgi:hypothetical protein